MSHENPIHQDLETIRPTANQEQKFALAELQAEHAQDLEASGTADRARQVLVSQHRNLTELYRASDLEADLPPEPKIGNNGDMTRAAVGSCKRKRNGAAIEAPSVVFITTNFDGPKPHEEYQFVPVAEIHKDGILTLDGFEPKDYRLVEGLLGELKDAKARGLVPDLNNSMAAIREPADDYRGLAMSQVPRIAP